MINSTFVAADRTDPLHLGLRGRRPGPLAGSALLPMHQASLRSRRRLTVNRGCGCGPPNRAPPEALLVASTPPPACCRTQSHAGRWRQPRRFNSGARQASAAPVRRQLGRLRHRGRDPAGPCTPERRRDADGGGCCRRGNRVDSIGPTRRRAALLPARRGVAGSRSPAPHFGRRNADRYLRFDVRTRCASPAVG